MKNYKELIGYIYKIISPNGKIYIGQTINVNQRKRNENPERNECALIFSKANVMKHSVI